MSNGMLSSLRTLLAGLSIFMFAPALIPSWAWAVTGGAPVPQGDAPWMVALADISRTADPACTESGGSELFCKQFCGGVLITPSWVLTAAHCVDGSLGSVANLRLVMEGADLNDPLANVVTVVEKVVHVNHDPAPTFDNDIALLKLASPVALQTASLVSESDFIALESGAAVMNDEVRLYGYGRLATAGDFASTLQQVAFDLQQDTNCSAVYNDASVVTYFPDVMLCAAEPDASDIEPNDAGGLDPADPDGEDACTYDSGGPLFGTSDAGLRVAGVVSFGDKNNCGDPARPSVYTQLDAYLPWIETVAAVVAAPVGDLGLDVSVAGSTAPGMTETVTVKLANGSANAVYAAPSFDITVTGGATLSLSDPGFLVCSQAGEAYACSYASDLQPGNQLTATFTLTPATLADETALVTASLTSGGPEDYRSDNDVVSRRVIFSDKPDLALTLDGLVTEVADWGNGLFHVFVTVSNTSASATASAVEVLLAPMNGEDYRLSSASGGTCVESLTVTCTLGDLAPGGSISLQMAFSSPSREDGQMQISTSASAPAYPAADTSVTGEVSFQEVQEQNPPPATGSRTSGGGEGSWLVILVSLALLRRWLRSFR